MFIILTRLRKLVLTRCTRDQPTLRTRAFLINRAALIELMRLRERLMKRIAAIDYAERQPSLFSRQRPFCLFENFEANKK